MNGFPDAEIPKEFKKDSYRILIVADMFQTGFDEPLLQTIAALRYCCSTDAFPLEQSASRQGCIMEEYQV